MHAHLHHLACSSTGESACSIRNDGLCSAALWVCSLMCTCNVVAGVVPAHVLVNKEVRRSMAVASSSCVKLLQLLQLEAL